MKFFMGIFCGALASSAYYLTIAKYSRENFRSTLKNHKNCESLAQLANLSPFTVYVHMLIT